MAKIWYEKTAQYRLPAWNVAAFHIDGFYVDSYLFEQNIPVLDITVSIWIAPQNSHTFRHDVFFSVPRYQNGVVDFLYHNFWWWPGQNHRQSDKILCAGHPYGMGINTIGVSCVLIGLISQDIVYDVDYIMEVEV